MLSPSLTKTGACAEEIEGTRARLANPRLDNKELRRFRFQATGRLGGGGMFGFMVAMLWGGREWEIGAGMGGAGG